MHIPLYMLMLMAAQAQAPPAGPIPLHAVEPIVVRDGSIKIDVYTRLSVGNAAHGDTLTVGAAPQNRARFDVPVAVVPASPAQPAMGRVKTTTERAHSMKAVDSYVYEIEKWDGRNFVPYAELEFKRQELRWIISPKGPGPLKLVRIGKPVVLSGDWKDHQETTYEYGYENLRLRLGAVTIGAAGSPSRKINLATGCTVFRIEPSIHSKHKLPFLHRPCEGVAIDPRVQFNKVAVKGVKTVQAIDVSHVRASH